MDIAAMIDRAQAMQEAAMLDTVAVDAQTGETLDENGTAHPVWSRLYEGKGLVQARQVASAAADSVGRPVIVTAYTARLPLSVIIPCHRVVGHDGRLTGYAGGLDLKVALLTLEGCHVAAGGRVRAAVSCGR